MKKILSVFLTVFICLFACNLSAYPATQSELKKKISEADEKIAKAKKDLQEAKNKQASAEKQKELIDNQISEIVSNIVYLNGQITSANEQIAQKEEEIEIAQAKLDENKEYFKSRVLSMYKSGTSTYMELLFGADNMGDFLNRVDMLQYVVKNDKKIVDEMTEARDAVIEAKAVIEERKADLEDSKVLSEQQKSSLDSALAQQQEIIAQLGQEIKVNEKEAAEAQKEKDALNRQLEQELSGYNAPSGGASTYSGGKMAWPTPQGGTITCPFGYRTYPSVGMHTGLDIGIRYGSTIAAAEAGTVIKVVNGTTGYGKYLMINHGGGVVTLYAHSSKIVVQVGEYVERGQKIAEIGSTGFSTGPHLHFEVRINGKAVNPIGYIT